MTYSHVYRIFLMLELSLVWIASKGGTEYTLHMCAGLLRVAAELDGVWSI